MLRDSSADSVSVLVPTYNRPAALAVTLLSLAFQTYQSFSVVISDQSDTNEVLLRGEIRAVIRILQLHGHGVRIYNHLPRKGIAEQRQFLLDAASTPYSLFLDDDCVLEPDVIERMVRALREENCGFVGCATIGLSYRYDIRPQEQRIEFWKGPVRPETVKPGSLKWERYKLHNAANLYHVQERLGITAEKQRKYKVAWVGGCVLYDTAKLKCAGGYQFWKELPGNICGEDVLAQLRVMKRYGGCGLLPSGVYHQELPTTLPDRSIVAAVEKAGSL